MLNLIKYEIIKAKTSKIVVLTLLVLLEIVYFFGIFANNEEVIGLSATVLSMLGTFAFIAVAIEALNKYSHDLNDKSGYLLFMTPHSNYTIIASKIITNILSVIVCVLVFGLFAVIDVTVALAYVGDLKDIIKGISVYMSYTLDIQVDWVVMMILMLISAFCSWVGFLTSGFLAITLNRTFFANKKGRGFISFIIFIVINVIYEMIASKLISALDHVTANISYLFSYGMLAILTAVFAAACYFGTVYMLNKKISL